MRLARKLQLLDERITAANEGTPGDLQEWIDRTEVVMRLVMGEGHPSLKKFDNISYSPSIWTENTDFRPYQRMGVQEAVSLLVACKDELKLAAEIEETVTLPDEEPEATKELAAGQGRVFVVHGHDEALKAQVARVLAELLGQQPVILHEQPNKGRVLIEKFEDHAAASGFAVVLLTADDRGGPEAASSEDMQPRARQNVIFEGGYFAAALGRERVVLLYEEGVEKPSDLDGLLYTVVDQRGAWKSELARELQAAGFTVDWSALGRL